MCDPRTLQPRLAELRAQKAYPSCPQVPANANCREELALAKGYVESVQLLTNRSDHVAASELGVTRSQKSPAAPASTRNVELTSEILEDLDEQTSHHPVEKVEQLLTVLILPARISTPDANSNTRRDPAS